MFKLTINNNLLILIFSIFMNAESIAANIEKENFIRSGDSVFWSAYFSKNLPNTLKVVSHANISLINRNNSKEFAIYLEGNDYVRDQVKNNKPIVLNYLLAQVALMKKMELVSLYLEN